MIRSIDVRRALVIGLLAVACDSEDRSNAAGAGGHGGGGAGAGGSPAEPDCWSAPLDAWELEPFDIAMLAGASPRDPMLSSQGLTLYYAATSENGFPRIYEATRSSGEVSFKGGTLLAEWLGQNPLGRPWRVGDELFMAEDNNGGVFHVVVSTLDGATWSLPAPPGSQINEGLSNGDPTLTEDGRRIVFTRQLASGMPTRLVEGARSAAAPGTPFSTFSDVAIPGVAAENFVVCPLLSPDGRMLFFSTVDIAIGDFAQVWVSERNSVDHAWEAPVHIGALDVASQHVCPHTVSLDGCELWIERFTPGTVVSGYAIAKRSPIP